MRPLQPDQKVFCLGLSRTGTTSLSRALNLLGINTIHYPKDQTTREELMEGNYDLTIFKHHQGFADITVAPFYAQFDRLMPNSKFILTVRDKASWLKSIKTHLRAYKTNDAFGKFLLSTAYGSVNFDREQFSRAYDQHVDSVSEYFKDRPDDYMMLNVVGGNGWEKLCPFLGVESPSEPFPGANTSKGDKKEAFAKRALLTSRALSELLPVNAAFVLVNDRAFGYELCPDRHAIPFLERDGRYFGKPADDQSAIKELTRLGEAGARFIVFTWNSFWWFEHYPAFHEHIRSNYRCVTKTDLIVVYQLDK